ncbi:MAG: RdgB/HAM1 family non-canonical purine NTP pyrophosphatase [Bacteroidales bacterium]|nr:RdgB/HAM1 family non-canonical purine NTP pyrophosphatase [Bacteroidales bacterium]
MKKLVFATNNDHKLVEIRNILNPLYEVNGLKEMGIFEEIPEDFFTLEENAFQKAEYLYKKLNISCFADDTGLEIDALNGEPGVFSARYSQMGEPQYPEMEIAKGNTRKVLEKLSGETDRRARFRTVIALILYHKKYTFTGIINGHISNEERGNKGFGYDPIFIPESSTLTFSEMSIEEKNRISHRALAVNKLVEFLKSRDQ